MYWTFIGLGSLLIFASISYLVKELLVQVSDKSSDKELEINILKKQILQIEKDEGDAIGNEDTLSKTIIARKILKLNKMNKAEDFFMFAPKNLTIWAAIVIAVSFLVGAPAIYIITNNFFQSEAELISNDRTLGPKLLSQKTVEELSKQTNRGPSKKIDSDFEKLEKLVEKLELVLQDRPSDLEGQKLLSENSARMGDFITARKAQAKILEILSSKASSADYSRYAEFCIIAAYGYISKEAKTAIQKAILLDKKNSQANFYQSLFFLQQDNTSAAFKDWIYLLKSEPYPSEWITRVISQISQMSDFLVKNTRKNKELNPDLLVLRMSFFRVLKALEKRLYKHEEPIEAWVSLIESYKKLQFTTDGNKNIRKMKSQFALSDDQLIKLNINGNVNTK